MTPFWVTAFVDLAPEAHVAGLAFWRDVTGWEVSPARGDDLEFVSLLPLAAGDHLRVQRLTTGPSRIHLDLHVDDPRTAADRAVALGAREVADPGHVVMRSPGGFTFCFVAHPAPQPAPASTWPGGHRSLVDQVCLDIPSSGFDREVDFWLAVTGRDLVDSIRPEFGRLRRPADQGLELLVQRLGEPTGEVRGHLDIGCSERAAETDRHLALGARLVQTYDAWTVLTDPDGSEYCITDREPRS
ncbi:VOC family protein [Nocardioides sp.]|uniref:VOC family protein n=1 Tax=Nocardioides sp. TaxID=35761 RepID=UPI002ED23AA6